MSDVRKVQRHFLLITLAGRFVFRAMAILQSLFWTYHGILYCTYFTTSSKYLHFFKVIHRLAQLLYSCENYLRILLTSNVIQEG